MAANEAVTRPKLQRTNSSPAHTPDTISLRPCLVHVPTGEIVKSYVQLSRIVKKLGWRVFINVSENLWGAWFIPAGGSCYMQMLFLPHPHISTASFHQLSTLVHAFGFNTFQISYIPLSKFRELEVFSDLKKPALHLRANRSQVLTVRNFARILGQHGWQKENESRFVKKEMSEKTVFNVQTVIKIPPVQNIQQLSTLDLEYIVLVTENIFYLEPHRRKDDAEAVKKLQPKLLPTSASASTSESPHTEKVEAQLDAAPQSATNPDSKTTGEEPGPSQPQNAAPTPVPENNSDEDCPVSAESLLSAEKTCDDDQTADQNAVPDPTAASVMEDPSAITP
ncbi:hypothetical protein R1sor_012114 [Riccia sorocarpa]|uniref:Uncharacterized protein n=1 Tax=Riccia sorocarpa TaxID=122646 RepID=A0ABD3I2V5_9MARC